MSERVNHIGPNTLTNILRSFDGLAVAVSGGVDSMTLAFLAHQQNPGCTLFHAFSPAVPESATARVRQYAEQFGWRLEIIDAGEMDDPDYRANPVNRCYYCKRNLYGAITAHTDAVIVSGTNLDDLSDYRPGLEAAKKTGVRHPFVEAGMDKQAVRKLADTFGLYDLAELPASPCLSSRVTTGIPIQESLLPLIDQVEYRLRALPGNAATDVRCRIRETGIAIQLQQPGNIDQSRITGIVRDVFNKSVHQSLCANVVIEPYQKGSAFVATQPVMIQEHP